MDLANKTDNEIAVIFKALDSAMRSEDWCDDDIINGMKAIDWAEYVCVEASRRGIPFHLAITNSERNSH